MISMKYYQDKRNMMMIISFEQFSYVFHFYEQPICCMKISLEDKYQMTILCSMNQNGLCLKIIHSFKYRSIRIINLTIIQENLFQWKIA